jgi:hypothetical protein
MITAESVKLNQQRMESARGAFEGAWQEIARLVYPEMAQFYGGSMASWANTPVTAPQMHDPYAAGALQDGVSLFEGFVVPRGQRYQKLALGDERLMASVVNRQWCEKVEFRLFSLRNDPDSGFVGAVHDSAMSLQSFGAQSTWIDTRRSPVTGRVLGLSYEAEFIGEIYAEMDASGRPLRLHRAFGLTAEQALRKWGDDAPKVVREAMKGDTPQRDKGFDFIHVIEPNRAYDPERIDAKGMPWASAYYIRGNDEEVFKRGGYRALPRIFSTWTRGVRTTWGFSPTMRVLPQIRLLQEIERDRVFGAELRLLPPLLAPDDELDGAIVELRGLGITHGGLDERGNPRLREFLTASDASDAQQLANEARQAIDRAFGRDLLQMNREYKTHITATRTSEEMAEKGMLLAPLARQESDWLSPMTQRELYLMGEIGLLDDMPAEVAEYFAAEGGFEWKYDNQLSRMMLAQDTSAFLSLGEQVAVLGQYNKDYYQHFNREFPPERVLTNLARNAGVPASMMATDEEKRAFDQEQAQAAAMEQMLQAAPAIADAAKNAAQAEAISGGGAA